MSSLARKIVASLGKERIRLRPETRRRVSVIWGRATSVGSGVPGVTVFMAEGTRVSTTAEESLEVACPGTGSDVVDTAESLDGAAAAG